MKRLSALLGMVMLVATNPVHAEESLNIYNWAGYTPPDLVEKFQKETGIKVTVDTYDSNETLLAKLMAGGGGYDVIVTAHNFIPIHVAEKLIQPIKLKDMKNAKYLGKQFMATNWNPSDDYAVPWQWGTTSFAVDTAVYDKPVDSYETLFSPPPELQGKLGMFKSQNELITMSQLYLGIPFCSEDPAEMGKVLEVLKAQKPHVKVYGTSASMGEQMISGELAIESGYSGRIQRVRGDKSSVKYIYPKEGVAGWIDVIAVPADAKNYENARKFIDFTLLPENAAMITNFAGYSSGVPEAAKFYKPELAGAPEMAVPDGIPMIPLQTCSPAAAELETQVMTELME